MTGAGLSRLEEVSLVRSVVKQIADDGRVDVRVVRTVARRLAVWTDEELRALARMARMSDGDLRDVLARVTSYANEATT